VTTREVNAERADHPPRSGQLATSLQIAGPNQQSPDRQQYGLSLRSGLRRSRPPIVAIQRRSLYGLGVMSPVCGDKKSMTDPLRIVLDPAVLVGKPVIRDTRLSVDFIIGLMADGWNEVDILRNYPGLSHDDVAACLAYARDVLRSEKIYPSAA
jgi:uncharacterized protein (DUF433 family)